GPAVMLFGFVSLKDRMRPRDQICDALVSMLPRSALATVHHAVSGNPGHFKVLQAVVLPVAIFMMHDVVASQWEAGLEHHQTVLSDEAAFRLHRMSDRNASHHIAGL